MFSFAFLQYLIFCTFSNKVGIYIWVFIQYFPLYVYGNLNNLGNVHILSLFPLAFYEMSLLPFCTKTAHFLIYFSDSLNTHTSTILYEFYPFSVAFSYCGLLFAHNYYFGLFVSPYINFTILIHLINAINITIITSIILHQILFPFNIVTDPYTITTIHIINCDTLFHKYSSIFSLRQFAIYVVLF